MVDVCAVRQLLYVKMSPLSPSLCSHRGFVSSTTAREDALYRINAYAAEGDRQRAREARAELARLGGSGPSVTQ